MSDLPPDIHPESRNRLPPVRREELSEEDRKLYDAAVSNPRSIVGLRGPAGIRLHSPELSRVGAPLQEHVRFHPKLERRLAELAILVTAREMDSQFEWTAHEPVGLREGLDQNVIDVVKHRRPTTGLGKAERAIVDLGREAVREHRVTSETFARAHACFGTDLLLHIVALMGQYMSTAILLATFDQQLPPGQEPLLPLG